MEHLHLPGFIQGVEAALAVLDAGRRNRPGRVGDIHHMDAVAGHSQGIGAAVAGLEDRRVDEAGLSGRNAAGRYRRERVRHIHHLDALVAGHRQMGAAARRPNDGHAEDQVDRIESALAVLDAAHRNRPGRVGDIQDGRVLAAGNHRMDAPTSRVQNGNIPDVGPKVESALAVPDGAHRDGRARIGHIQKQHAGGGAARVRAVNGTGEAVVGHRGIGTAVGRPEYGHLSGMAQPRCVPVGDQNVRRRGRGDAEQTEGIVKPSVVVIPDGADQHGAQWVGHVHDQDPHHSAGVQCIDAIVAGPRECSSHRSRESRTQTRRIPQSRQMGWIGDINSPQPAVPARHQRMDAAVGPLKYLDIPRRAEGRCGAGAIPRAVHQRRTGRIRQVQDTGVIAGNDRIDAAVGWTEHIHIPEPRVGMPDAYGCRKGRIVRICHIYDLGRAGSGDGQQVGMPVVGLERGCILQPVLALPGPQFAQDQDLCIGRREGGGQRHERQQGDRRVERQRPHRCHPTILCGRRIYLVG